ncbi:MAG TPA: hypothetical protein VGM46_11960, partial [Mesorhizobium sp.]
ASLCLLCGMASAHAEPGGGVSASSSLERHWTSNALDSDHAVPDWYTLLRGSLQQQFGDDDANIGLGAEFQATRHDRVSIEDDRALALSAHAFRRFSPSLELRGTLTYRVSREGDDLPIGAFTLGTSTPKQILGASGQMGIDLGNATSLILDVADTYEKVGETRFGNELLLPAQLDPDLNRFQLGAHLTRTFGAIALGVSASALWMAVQELGSPPVALSLAQYTLRGELTYTGADGSTLGAAFGGEFLRGANDTYSRLRPTWQITFARQLPHDLELRGTYFGRFETLDSDDPLASWLQRGELELGMKLRENLAFASGLFAEEKENLLFENVERKRGLYAELTCDATPSMAIVLRVDVSKTFKTVIEERESTVDTFVGLRAKI